VRFGKSFQRYEKLANGSVKIFFDDGTVDECDLWARTELARE
jgi:hypothetical protein